jgi:hypothetical protein
VILLDTLLIGGIRFVLDKIATAVDRELNDEGSLREELLALQMRYELGEIEDEEYAAAESGLLDRLREVRRLRTGQAAGEEEPLSFDPSRHTVGVEVTFAGEEEP